MRELKDVGVEEGPIDTRILEDMFDNALKKEAGTIAKAIEQGARIIFSNATQASVGRSFSQWCLDNDKKLSLKGRIDSAIKALNNNKNSMNLPLVMIACNSGLTYTLSVYPKIAKSPIRFYSNGRATLDYERLNAYF